MKQHMTSGGSKTAQDGSLSERRPSMLSEQERQQAREFRAKALKDGCASSSRVYEFWLHLCVWQPTWLPSRARLRPYLPHRLARRLRLALPPTLRYVCLSYPTPGDDLISFLQTSVTA